MRLANYLFFTTTCEAALEFYTRCGLGRATVLARHGEGPMHGKVMHARFDGPGFHFYASDNDDAEPMRGSAHYLELDTREETGALFDKLAEGGTITTPLRVQPWGAYFGKLTDRFGVQWMFSARE